MSLRSAECGCLGNEPKKLDAPTCGARPHTNFRCGNAKTPRAAHRLRRTLLLVSKFQGFALVVVTTITSTTTTKVSFSPLFETAVRRTHRGWCLSSMGPNQGRMSVTRWSLFGHSRPLISSDKPRSLSIDSNYRQHTTQAVINGQLTF